MKPSKYPNPFLRQYKPKETPRMAGDTSPPVVKTAQLPLNAAERRALLAVANGELKPVKERKDTGAFDEVWYWTAGPSCPYKVALILHERGLLKRGIALVRTKGYTCLVCLSVAGRNEVVRLLHRTGKFTAVDA